MADPARTLGPDVVLRQFDRTCWIYYVSSYAAALVTAGFYMALRASHYTSVVPDQDAEMVQEMKQVVRDVHGNVIGSIDMVPASEGAPLLEDQAALAAEEGRVAPGMAEASAGNSDFTYAAKDDATYSHDVLRHKTSSSSTAAPPVAPARAI
jgi:D-alanyl-D-alanine carboxypeptidase